MLYNNSMMDVDKLFKGHLREGYQPIVKPDTIPRWCQYVEPNVTVGDNNDPYLALPPLGKRSN